MKTFLLHFSDWRSVCQQPMLHWLYITYEYLLLFLLLQPLHSYSIEQEMVSGAVLGGESSSAATSAGSSNGFCPDELVLESRVQRVLVWTGFTDFASHLQNLSVCSNDRGRELSGRQLREGLNDASEFAAPSLLFGGRRTRVQRSSVQTGSMNAAF